MPFGATPVTTQTDTPVNEAAMRSANMGVVDAPASATPATPVAVEVVPEVVEPAETAPKTTAEEPAIEKVDFKAVLDGQTALLGGLFEETERLLEEELFQTPALQSAFSVVAQELGIPDYDFAKSKTFQYVVSGTGSRFLAGPQIQAYGDPATASTCCIVWDYITLIGEGKDAKETVRQHVIPLPADADVNSMKWRISPPSEDRIYCEIFYEVRRFKFPFPLRVNGDWTKGSDLASAFLEVENFADLAKFLQNGAPIARWDENSPDEVLIQSATKLTRSDGSDFVLCSAVDKDSNPYRLYLNDLQLLDAGILPAMARKPEGENKLEITPEGGVEPFKCAIGGNISKLLDAAQKTMYFISHIELMKGEERTSVVLTLEDSQGGVGQYWSNKKLGDLILTMVNDGEDPETITGFLRVTGHKKTRDGAKFPDLQYWLLSTFTNPITQRIMKKQGVQFPGVLLQKAVASLPAGTLPEERVKALTEA